jgi:hypothetical protein
MSGRTNDEEISTNLVDEFHDHANGMAAHNVDLHFDSVLPGLKARALDDRMESARGDPFRFPHLLDVFRHWRDFLDANEVKRRGILFGHCNRQVQRLESGFRPVVGMQDGLEHRARLRLFGWI